MKKSLFIFLFVFLASKIIIAQEPQRQISYMTGSLRVSGYSVLTKTMNISSYTFTSESVRAPILQVYVCDKNNFLGGFIEDEKGQTTKILDIKTSTIEGGVKFEVVGEKFSKFLTTQDGEMLKEEKTYTVFYMPGIGIWTIYKKGAKVKK